MGRRTRMGVQSAESLAGPAPRRAGHLRPRGRRGGPRGTTAVSDRGPPPRALLSLHAGPVAFTRLRHSRGRAPVRQCAGGHRELQMGEGLRVEPCLGPVRAVRDNRVWAHTPSTGQVEILYDDNLFPDSPLHGVDNVTVSRSGDLYVAEDGDDLQLCLITPQPERIVSPFLQLQGHAGSELTGPAFSPDGHRLYFSSQRGTDGQGVTFEVSGPFR